MKHIGNRFALIFFCLYVLWQSPLCAQKFLSNENTAPLKTVVGMQIGYLGTWGYLELPILSSVVLRTDLGVDFATGQGSSSFSDSWVVGAPSISLSPRWYHNWQRRIFRRANTSGNAANYLELRTTVNPGVVLISTRESLDVLGSYNSSLMYGIRRRWYGLSVEVGGGFGYDFLFTTGRTTRDPKPFLHLRLGL